MSSELHRLAPPDVGKSLPRQADVELYIRAYYHDPDLFLPFVKEHIGAFTQRQVISIINQGFGKAMKSDLRKSLISVIGEIYSRHEQFDLKL